MPQNRVVFTRPGFRWALHSAVNAKQPNRFNAEYTPSAISMVKFMSVVVIPIIGLVSRACLRVNSVSVTGIDILQRALREENRRGQGVLTSEFLILYHS